MTSQPEEQPCLRSPPQSLILPPLIFCHHPLSILSPLFLILLIILTVPTASLLAETGSTLLRNTTLTDRHLFFRTTTMSPKESSFRMKPRDSGLSSQPLKPILPVFSCSSGSNSSENEFLEDCRTKTEFDNTTKVISEVTKHFDSSRPYMSSNISDKFERTDKPAFHSSAEIRVNNSVKPDVKTGLPFQKSEKSDLSKVTSYEIKALSSRDLVKTDQSGVNSARENDISSHNLQNAESSGDKSPFTDMYSAKTLENGESFYHMPGGNFDRDPMELSSDISEIYEGQKLSLRVKLRKNATLLAKSQNYDEIVERQPEYPVNLTTLYKLQLLSDANESSLDAFTKPSKSVVPKSESDIFKYENITTIDFQNYFRTKDLNSTKKQMYGTYVSKNISQRSVQNVPNQMKTMSLMNSKIGKSSSISSTLSQLSTSTTNKTWNNLERITLLGLFEMTTRNGERAEGRSELAAARLAISHINQKQLLPGYQLELITNDTKVTRMFLPIVEN
ncbi:uncharacterized protein [Periplaneta americana]|uniref:uncharacterized protein n=1 Tax=Periplaneta americana TaxID=6978 RepID=UPI0037E7ECA1